MTTKILLRITLIFLWTAVACKQIDGAPSTPSATGRSENSAFAFTPDKTDKTVSDSEYESQKSNVKVWVCKSDGATKYHYNRNCGGLKRCSHTVESKTIKEAEAVGLTRCAYKRCN